MRDREYACISSSLITKYQNIFYRYNKSSNHGIDIFKDLKVTLIKNNIVNKKIAWQNRKMNTRLTLY